MGNFLVMLTVTVMVVATGWVICYQYTIGQIDALTTHRLLIMENIATKNERVVDMIIKPGTLEERAVLVKRMMEVCFEVNYSDLTDHKEKAIHLTNRSDVAQVKTIDARLAELNQRLEWLNIL